jgi:hypothetical protein
MSDGFTQSHSDRGKRIKELEKRKAEGVSLVAKPSLGQATRYCDPSCCFFLLL